MCDWHPVTGRRKDIQYENRAYSDTQVPSAELSPKVKAAFEGVDLILHAGDILVPSCLDYLEEIAPVKAVETGAERQLRGDSRVVEHHRVVEVEGHSIGIVHELSIPPITALEILPGVIDKSYPADASLPNSLEEVFGAPVDIVVYGFSHISLVEEHKGILFINPGKRYVAQPEGDAGHRGRPGTSPTGTGTCGLSI